MTTLRKLLGYDDKFFDLLDASAIGAQKSVQLLAQLIKDPAAAATLDNLVQERRKGKRLVEEITEELCGTFVTPLDREDIEALATALYKIPKTVEKFSEIFFLCRDDIAAANFSRQLAILEQSVANVVQMVTKLRQRANLDTMREHNHHLHQLEGEADKLMLELIRDLYSGTHAPVQVIITMDLYEKLERIIDRCRDAGNILFQVVLKCS